MVGKLFNPNAPKKSTNLSVNSDLLRQARENRINLSQTLEQRLAELLLEEKRRRWREENREAIEAYNQRIGTRGVFSDGLRRFWWHSSMSTEIRTRRRTGRFDHPTARRRALKGADNLPAERLPKRPSAGELSKEEVHVSR
ncbi:MAG: type II toxin-antitoxin system CcdA family antitoxin [Candidatus Tectomicrobia bacterium]|uniref:Type II toxin-antitoxin system CcdA family antitoxin n=1 Tax=Tectimicrobiota bacterium TaxID=2528274 RepID=A0A932M027_UNCTE|nr:type II toxin-antitoxin system CcdA family antitoxin [Candidatus Tectomicrobia bacterium]